MRDSASFDSGQIVIDQARKGRYMPCGASSEEGESFVTRRAPREERPAIVRLNSL